MSVKVPEGMLKAAVNAIQPSVLVGTQSIALKAALLWQRDNVPVPTVKRYEFNPLCPEDGIYESSDGDLVMFPDVVRWIRRMYDAPEPEVPSEIKDIESWLTVYLGSHPEFENMKRNVILAFRRGQRSQKV